MDILANLGINPGLLLIWIIAFIVVYTVMTRFVYDPLTNVLNERRNRIAKGLEDAAAAARARENAESEAEKVLAQARSEAQKVIDEARGRGEDVASSIEQEARQEAAKIQYDAQSEAVAIRNQELGNLREQVVNISVAVASRIMGESMTKAKQKALVDSFISDLPEGAKGYRRQCFSRQRHAIDRRRAEEGHGGSRRRRSGFRGGSIDLGWIGRTLVRWLG